MRKCSLPRLRGPDIRAFRCHGDCHPESTLAKPPFCQAGPPLRNASLMYSIDTNHKTAPHPAVSYGYIRLNRKNQ